MVAQDFSLIYTKKEELIADCEKIGIFLFYFLMANVTLVVERFIYEHELVVLKNELLNVAIDITKALVAFFYPSRSHIYCKVTNCEVTYQINI